MTPGRRPTTGCPRAGGDEGGPPGPDGGTRTSTVGTAADDACPSFAEGKSCAGWGCAGCGGPEVPDVVYLRHRTTRRQGWASDGGGTPGGPPGRRPGTY